jgi:DNA primase
VNCTEDQVRAVLEVIGLDIVTEPGNDFMVYCPFHNNWRTPAAEVTKDTGRFYCFACGETTSLEYLVMKVSGRNYFESLRLIVGKGVESNISSDVVKVLDKQPDYIAFDSAIVDDLYQNMRDYRDGRAYLELRGIADSIDKFKLGYSRNQRMVTVPVHSPDGILLGFVGRGIEEKVFRNTPGLPKSKTLFNLNRAKTSPYVFIVESSFDAMRLDQQDVAAVATLGATVSKKQLELLTNYYNKIYLVPDADQAGKDMTEKLSKHLGSKLTVLNLPQGAKDVGDLTDDQIKKLKKHIDNPLLGVLQ